MSHIQSGWPSSFIHMEKALRHIDVKVLKSLKIAFIDTGLSPVHSCFQGISIERLSASELISPDDTLGHGTFFAGVLIGLFTVNRMPPPQLLSISAGSEGKLSPALICVAVKKAIEQGVDVINIGACNTTYSPEMATVISEAVKRGIIVTAPAGNNIETEATYPAALHTVISCGSIDKNGVVAGHSNRHSRIDVYAPGSCLKGPLTPLQAECLGVELDECGLAVLSGTSFAAASVAAVALLVKCQHPEFGYEDFRTLLHRLPFHTVEIQEDIKDKIRLLDIGELLREPWDTESELFCSPEAPPLYWKVWSEKFQANELQIYGLIFDHGGEQVLDLEGHACIRIFDYNSSAGQTGAPMQEITVDVREGKIKWTLCMPSAGMYMVSLHMPEVNALVGILRVAIPPCVPVLQIHELEHHRRVIELLGSSEDMLLFYSFDHNPIRYDPGQGPLPGTNLYTHPLVLPSTHQWFNYASWSKGFFSECHRYDLWKCHNS